MATLKKIGVIGAGNMGSGIAQKIATEGYSVALVDVSDEAAAAGIARIRTLLEEGVTRKLFTSDQVVAILSRLSAGSDFGLLADCDLVIEAVFEDRKVKADVFARAAEKVSPQAILATNTSSFRVADLAAGVPHPERFVGLHYFYHPAKNRLVEVVPHQGTGEQVTGDTWRFQEIIGKTPIASADCPGFVVNRYFVPWLNEAVRLLEEEVADIPTIEAAAKKAFGIGMGPFELMNVTGVPIALHAATTLGEELGPFYAPARALAAQVASKMPWNIEGEVQAGKVDAVASRLRAVVFLVAGQMLDEGVCTPEDCDIGARVGLRWTQGPIELMNSAGIQASVTEVERLGAHWKLETPRCLVEQAASRAPFPLAVVDCKVADGIATVRINRPDAMNALDPVVVQQLAERFDAAAADPAVKTIVLAGSGKAFVAGADVKFFVDQLDADAYSKIEAFTRNGQDLLRRIDDCPKQVICRLDGLSLGGGSELALCADVIVATDRALLAFPETGIGIYPGLGGTQRLMRRVGKPLAKYLIYSGQMVSGRDAEEAGLVDELVATDALDQRIKELAKGHGLATRAMRPSRYKPLADFCDAHTVKELLGKKAPEGDVHVEKLLKRLRQKAPIALELAEKCIETGDREGEDAGLACEMANLERIFSTKDAYEGLSSLVAGRRPAFKGH